MTAADLIAREIHASRHREQLDTQLLVEFCACCGEPTGRAGRHEDSIYCDKETGGACEAGPFCWPCWNEHEHNPERGP